MQVNGQESCSLIPANHIEGVEEPSGRICLETCIYRNPFDRPFSARPAEDGDKDHSILEPIGNRPPRVRVQAGSIRDEDETRPTTSLRVWRLFVCLVLTLPVSVKANSQSFDNLVERYEEFLLFKQSDYQDIAITKETFRDVLMSEFNRAVRRVSDYPYDDPLRDPGGTPGGRADERGGDQ